MYYYPLRWLGFEKESLWPLRFYFAITPLVAVIVVCYVLNGEEGVKNLFKKFRVKGFAHKWFFLSTWSFSIIAMTALILRFIYDGFFPPFEDFGPIDQMLLWSLPLFFFPGVTEEFGWRGFLQSRLQQKFPAVFACMITGLVWGAWYYPDFIIGNWEYTNVAQVSLFSFTMAASIFIGWLFIQTDENVFIAMLAHFGANIVFTFSPLFKVYGDLNHVSISFYIMGLVWIAVILVAIVVNYGIEFKR